MHNSTFFMILQMLLFFFLSVGPGFEDYNYRDADYCHNYSGGYLWVAAVQGSVFGREDRVGDGFVSFSLEDLLPRPDFNQGADHEAGPYLEAELAQVLPGREPGEEC